MFHSPSRPDKKKRREILKSARNCRGQPKECGGEVYTFDNEGGFADAARTVEDQRLMDAVVLGVVI